MNMNNSGHGHVTSRADGIRARCGGPQFCRECQREQIEKNADPLSMPLPCDITIGHVTMRKGVPLRVLVQRMEVLYNMAQARSAS